MNGEIRDRVLLVGFMASGKSSVGKELASRLGWDFVDFDTLIESRTGKTVARIFSEDGEEEFRRLESEVAKESLVRRDTVFASGGGWPAQPESWTMVAEDTMSIWLQVSPLEALRRASKEGLTRPLLGGADAMDRATALLLAREAFYRRARYTLDSERHTPPELADEIVKLMEGAT